jgi:hypothetical protein
LAVSEAVRQSYVELWDGLQSEKWFPPKKILCACPSHDLRSQTVNTNRRDVVTF